MYNIEVYDAELNDILEMVEGIPEDALASEMLRLFREHGDENIELVVTVD